MPSFEKRSGRIRCKVTVNGRRESATFDTKAEAKFWAEAVFRLSKKLNVLELAAVIGHRDISSLQFYYRTTAEELADKL